MRMRNKILVLIGVVAMALSLAGCSCATTAQAKQEKMFEWVCRDSSFEVVQHNKTGVLYLLVDYRTGYTITPLLNPDGTPMTIDDWDDNNET